MGGVPAQIAPPPNILHDVTIVTTKKLAQAKVMGVPPEECGIERGARSIRDCNYFFHEVVTKTEAQLIDEGFDADEIKAITEYTGISEIETIERDTVTEHLAITGAQAANSAARLVKITEHYVRMDYEGKGRPCLYMVVTGGDQGNILTKDGKPCIERVDVIPFAAVTPVPQPHRFFGRSIADITMELQRQATALKRGLLDNIYLHNNQRTEVSESHAGPNTLDDMLTSRPGGVVRTKQPGGVNPLQTQDITGAIYPGLQYLDAEVEARTGLAKQTQGIDANALQNQTATAVAQVFSASQMRIKLVARILAEGVRDMFSLLHGTIRKHGGQAQTVRLRNRWVQVDPRNWKTRDDMTINVGLGSGGKAQQFAQMMAIANVQKEMIAGGKPHLVGDDGLYNTAAELCKIMGFRNPDRFFNDPNEKDPQTGQLKNPPPPPQPDPKVAAIQAQAQNDQQEIQLKAMLDQQKAKDAAALAQLKAETDAKLKVLEAHIEALKVERQMAMDQQKHHAKLAETTIDVVASARKHDMEIAHQREAHDQKLELAREAARNKKEGDK